MKTFRLMLAFFTRLPVPAPPYTEERYIKGLKWIPFVGVVMGCILYALSFFGRLFDPPVTALVLLSGYLYITGGLHLDGLADSCDGMLSGRDRDRILEIMKDSRVGSFGVLAMLFFFSFYMVMFQYIPAEGLLLLPVIGKSAPLISASLSEYARPEGMGKLLADHVGKKEVCVALLLPVVMAVVIPLVFSAPVRMDGSVGCVSGSGIVAYLMATAAAFLSVVGLTRTCRRILGGITGDTMGMVCEVSQMVFVFVLYVIQLYVVQR